MVAAGTEHHADAGRIETAASEACTRSGTLGLLLASSLFLLSAYWLQEKKDEAAAEYVGDRTSLAMYVDILTEDNVWQEYKRSHPEAERMPMSQLLHATVDISQSPQVDPEPKLSNPGQNTLQASKPKSQSATPASVTGRTAAKPVVAPAPPEAPTMLSVKVLLTADVYEMARIRESLEKLNDAELLTRSRQASNFFEFSIVRWVQKRGAIMYANALTGVCQAPVLELPRKSKSTYYTPQLDGKALLDCLTLGNVQDLAKFELPTFTNPNSMGRHAAQDVDLSPGALPRDPYMATIVAQVLLFLVLAYFAAFTREAASVDSFPTPGTLFGAFSRSNWTVVVFLLALWTPLVACCMVLITSQKPSLGIFILPIALVTLHAQRTLNQTLFFGRWKLLAFFERFKSWLHRPRAQEPPEA